MLSVSEIHGRYADAKVFTDLIEESAIEQLQLLCNQPFVVGCKIRVMPDVHSGAGCVIGFTADLGDRVIPNIVGVDIGCGMLTVNLGKTEPNYQILDEIIHNCIPFGMNVNDVPVEQFSKLTDLYCYNNLINTQRIVCSIGTLGGGNHFIEVDRDQAGNYFLVIHTGSRNLGKQVAEYYQNIAVDECSGKRALNEKTKSLITEYKVSGREKEIQHALRILYDEFSASHNMPPEELCYVSGENRGRYLHDMKICQEFAALNRRTIANQILKNLFEKSIYDFDSFETIHNYIDHESNIIRKGAVSARKGEKLLIPINMRDGSLICVGKGNVDWNNSAPHGAGRLYSRSTAKQIFDVHDFKEEMEGIYSTSINEQTLDECPMAYKPIESIINNIEPTAEIIDIIRPTYNFKAY